MKDIIPLESIIHKKTVNFDEAMAILYHSFEKIHKNAIWSTYINDHFEDMQLQNNRGWPSLYLTQNYYKNKFYCYPEKLFIDSKNIFTLLYRVQYIENAKMMKDYTVLNIHKINVDIVDISTMNIGQIFDMLYIFITKYVEMYQDTSSLEYRLGILIQKCMNE